MSEISSTSALTSMLSSVLGDISLDKKLTSASANNTNSLASVIADFYASQNIDEGGNVIKDSIGTTSTETIVKKKKKSGGLFGKLKSAFKKVVTVVSKVCRIISPIMSKINPAIGGAISAVGRMAEDLVEKGKLNLSSLTNALSGMFSSYSDSLLGSLSTSFSGVFGRLLGDSSDSLATTTE